MRKYWAPAVGLVAIIVGVFAVQAAPPASFGWFAYAPLSSTTFIPPFFTGQLWIGLSLATAGVALLSGWVGFRIGARGNG